MRGLKTSGLAREAPRRETGLLKKKGELLYAPPHLSLVAGVGFEPTTFGLLARSASTSDASLNKMTKRAEAFTTDSILSCDLLLTRVCQSRYI